MISYKADENFIYLNGSFNNYMMLNELNAAKVKAGYRFPRNLHVYRELYLRFGALKNDKQFMEDAHLESREFNARNKFKQREDVFNRNPKLRDYQQVDAEFMSKLEYGALFNEMRTGEKL